MLPEGFPFHQFNGIKVEEDFKNLPSIHWLFKVNNKISFKKEELPNCSVCFNFCVRHLGTFVNASHNCYTVSPLPRS